MEIVGNTLKYKNIYIDDIERAALVASILVTFITLAILFNTYNYILSAQRESILAASKIKAYFVTLPFIGEITFYTKFNYYSTPYIIIKTLFRLFQIALLSITAANIYNYIIVKIGDLIDKTDYAKINNFDLNKVFIIILVLEISIIILSIFINISVSRITCNSRLLGLLISICPILGYSIVMTAIKMKDKNSTITNK